VLTRRQKVKIEKKTVVICTRDGAEEKRAEIHGGHFALFKVKYGWNITHIASGLSIYRQVIGRKSVALGAIDILLTADWASAGGSFGRPPDFSREDIKRVIRETNRFLYGTSSY